jgi:hypothetical protein
MGRAGAAAWTEWPDLTRGDGPYACWRIGLASGPPPLARYGPSRGFPCQIRPRSWNSQVDSGPKSLCFSRQPTGAGPAVAGAAA